MSTLADPAPTAHPQPPRTGDWLAAHLAPVAAELAGTLRDYDLADVHDVLAAVPDGQRTDLILVLAAMVDVDRSPAELLEWTGRPPISRDDGDWARPPASKRKAACPVCGALMRADHLGRHRDAKHPDTVVRAA